MVTGIQQDFRLANTGTGESGNIVGRDAVKSVVDIFYNGQTKLDDDEADEIYGAVKDFLINTDFNPDLIPPHKY